MEVDILAINGEYAVLIEAKKHVKDRRCERAYREIREIQDIFPGI